VTRLPSGPCSSMSTLTVAVTFAATVAVIASERPRTTTGDPAAADTVQSRPGSGSAPAV